MGAKILPWYKTSSQLKIAAEVRENFWGIKTLPWCKTKNKHCTAQWHKNLLFNALVRINLAPRGVAGIVTGKIAGTFCRLSLVTMPFWNAEFDNTILRFSNFPKIEIQNYYYPYFYLAQLQAIKLKSSFLRTLRLLITLDSRKL